MTKCENCGAESSSTTECEYCGSSMSAPPASAPAPAPAPAPAASGAASAQPQGGSEPSPTTRAKASTGLAIVAGVSLLCGVGGLFASSSAKGLERQLQQVPVKTLEEAASYEGMVCIEGVVPEVKHAVRVPGVNTDCVYYSAKHERRDQKSSSSEGGSSSRSSRWGSWKTTRTDEFTATTLAVGELVVKPQGASWRGTTELHQIDNRRATQETRVTYTGVPVTSRLTIFGKLQGGTISGGDPFLIAVAPSQKAVIDQLESTATMMKVMGFLALFVALGAGVGAALAFLKR